MSKDVVMVRVFDLVGSPICVSTDDGQAVFEKIAPLLEQGQSVEVSFENVDTLTSAFLNAALGQLYGRFAEETIRALVSARDMAELDRELLKRVVENAKVYFANRAQFDEAWRGEIGDDDEPDGAQ